MDLAEGRFSDGISLDHTLLRAEAELIYFPTIRMNQVLRIPF